MKKLDPGQAITILANVGVLVGIILLIYELSQNRQMMQAQTRNELSQAIINQLSDSAADEDLAALILRGQTGRLQSELDQRRYQWWLLARFRYWENVHYQYRLGLYDEEECAAQVQAFIPSFRYQGFQEYWARVKQTFSPEFVVAVDEMLEREITE